MGSYSVAEVREEGSRRMVKLQSLGARLTPRGVRSTPLFPAPHAKIIDLNFRSEVTVGTQKSKIIFRHQTHMRNTLIWCFRCPESISDVHFDIRNQFPDENWKSQFWARNVTKIRLHARSSWSRRPRPEPKIRWPLLYDHMWGYYEQISKWAPIQWRKSERKVARAH